MYLSLAVCLCSSSQRLCVSPLTGAKNVWTLRHAADVLSVAVAGEQNSVAFSRRAEAAKLCAHCMREDAQRRAGRAVLTDPAFSARTCTAARPGAGAGRAAL